MNEKMARLVKKITKSNWESTKPAIVDGVEVMTREQADLVAVLLVTESHETINSRLKNYPKRYADEIRKIIRSYRGVNAVGGKRGWNP
jgi:hypothetical protein